MEFLLRLGKSGNFTQNSGKIRKKLYWKIEKNTGKVREACHQVILKILQILYHIISYHIILYHKKEL